MAQLNNKAKEFIVKHLAMFERPSEIRELVKEKFSIQISRQQVAYYNPENSQGGRQLARKWRHLFDKTRDRFISESGQIPIAHKNYRLGELQKIFHRLVDRGELIEACKVLEQAAKEMGGAYSYRQKAEPPLNNNGSFYEQINKKILKLNKN